MSTNIELEKVVESIPLLRSHFMGVFNKDTLPEMKNDYCCIFNIENSVDGNGMPLPGTHWLACGVRQSKSWCFDSFGLAPPDSLKTVLDNPILYNTRQVQAKDSFACGWYSLGACLAVHSSPDRPNDSLRMYVDLFTEPILKNNDRILTQYLATFLVRK